MDFGGWWYCFLFPALIVLILLAEIILFPFACLAIIPIGISSYSLSGSYLRAGEYDTNDL